MAGMLQRLLTLGALLLLTGFASALKGPPELSAFLGWPLSLGCQYEEGFRTHKKYWCKGPRRNYCAVVVETDGTEAEAKAGRTSIQDNHRRLEFTVRLEDVSQEDAGIYWCGIKQVGYDPGFQIQITALPEFASALKGPPEVSAFLGWPLSFGCQYEEGFRTHKKYWCKGSIWSSCTTVVETDGTEAEAKVGRTLIQDNHSRLEFTIRLENVSQENAGIYWCGIKQVGYDPGFQIQITALPGESASKPVGISKQN
ncbi:CMRF35-like molecule 1 isoform X2 [Pogona vitticeps]